MTDDTFRMSEPAGLAGAKRREERPRWGCLLLIIVAGLVGFNVVSRVFTPSDWVEVTVGPLTEGSQNFCILADEPDGVVPLSWYHAKVVVDAMSPFIRGEFWGEGRRTDSVDFFKSSVQWREARRYGVLVRRKDGLWRLYWLGPEATKRPSWVRYLSPNSSEAALRLPAEDQGEVPSPEFLKTLGWSGKD